MMRAKLLQAAVLGIFLMQASQAATTCQLDRPDQDVKRIFPESTTYRVRDLSPTRHGEKDLMKKIEDEMHEKLVDEFEGPTVPRTFYVVYKGDQYVGILHGINAVGADGPLQVFVAYEKSGKVRDVYIQKIHSDDAAAFRSKYYRKQFARWSTEKVLDEPYAIPPVRMPSPATIKDHHAVIRSVRLNVYFVKHLYNRFKEGVAK